MTCSVTRGILYSLFSVLYPLSVRLEVHLPQEPLPDGAVRAGLREPRRLRARHRGDPAAGAALPTAEPTPATHAILAQLLFRCLPFRCLPLRAFHWFFALGTLTGRVDLEGGRNSVSGGRTTKDTQSLQSRLRIT